MKRLRKNGKYLDTGFFNQKGKVFHYTQTIYKDTISK